MPPAALRPLARTAASASPASIFNASASASPVKASLFARMASTQCPIQLDDPTLFKTQSYINGQWVDAAEKFKVYNPADEAQVIGECPELGVKETREAVQHAHAAFKLWNKATPKERSDKLYKLYNLCMQHQSDLAKLITLENGKSFTDAKAEATYGSGFIEWFAGEAVRERGDIVANMGPGVRNVVIKQGVDYSMVRSFAQIFAKSIQADEEVYRNFPLAMGTRKFGAALAAGATVVMKAPDEAPFTALAFAELCHRAEIPAGVLNILTSQKNLKEIGKELCENQTVRKISFTGSTRVGKILMAQSSESLKKMSLELGGNAPFIVFDDADIEAAAAGAIACKFRGNGQTCVCANRIYVHAAVYDKFVETFVAKVKALKVGDGFEEGVNCGPLIHQAAVQKVQQHVDDAVSKGAKVLAGGKHIKGNFFEPTVLGGMTRECAISEEETFGPVAALYKFNSEEEVLKLANDVDVGLAGYFFSRDIGRIWRVAEELETGMVGVNTGMIAQVSVPFGGVKHSGIGREGSKYGIEEYQSIKLITMGGLS